MRALIAAVAALTQSAAALGSETLTCSTWQGIRTCSSPNGYVSHESTRNGITTGDDNRGNRWTTSRWRGDRYHNDHAAGALTLAGCALGVPTVWLVVKSDAWPPNCNPTVVCLWSFI